ncbi:MAG: sugar phosphate isomerase/epimerase [Planctomycetes bacterium]|nr:sugar phosphate isomerase/epimerase [Planctomycetota bacterium]
MKFGLNLLLWTTHVTQGHERELVFAKACGFDGVEVPLFEGDPDHYARLALLLDRIGLRRTCSMGLAPEHNPIARDPAVRRAAAARLRWGVDCATALGAETLCGPLHSAFKVFVGRGPDRDEVQWSAEALRNAAQAATPSGLLIAPEALNRFECYLVNTAAQLRELCELAAHPLVKAHYDTHHMHIEEADQGRAIDHCAPVLGHVHLSENDRGVPGRGQVHWQRAFEGLRRSGYDGWCVIEAFSRRDAAFAAGIHVWRDYFVAPEDVGREGLAFVRRGLG